MESYEIIWNAALPEIQVKVATVNYTTFIEPLKPIDIVGSKLVLFTPSEINERMITNTNMID